MTTGDVQSGDRGLRREKAFDPEDLGRMFIERANAGDVDGCPFTGAASGANG